MRAVRQLSALVVAAAALATVPQPAGAQIRVYTVNLSGPAESPANASPGIGTALVVHDPIAHTMTLDVVFSGLLQGVTAAHIHCCTTLPFTGVLPFEGPGTTAGVATQTPTFTGFPGGLTAGSYHRVFDLLDNATYNTSPTALFNTAGGGTAAGTEIALFNGADAGRAYLNIHTTLFPGGEIRGFLVPIPEPATWALLATGLGTLGVIARRRRAG